MAATWNSEPGSVGCVDGNDALCRHSLMSLQRSLIRWRLKGALHLHTFEMAINKVEQAGSARRAR